MFCPFCKAEYRAGIKQCSDCSSALVPEIPRSDSDPNFMVLLWNGESLPFLETVCAELDRAGVAVATPRVEVLLRDSADRYHLRQLKTFPFVLGVLKKDFAAARKILETVSANDFPQVILPPVGAYSEPFDQSATESAPRKSSAPLEATAAISSSTDLRYLEFLEASLNGLDIATRRVVLESGGYEIRVRPSDKGAALKVVEEIASGASHEAAAAAAEDSILRDAPPTKSRFLIWLFLAAYWFTFWGLYLVSDGPNASSGRAMFAILLAAMQAISTIGSFWLVYQALRYEVKPVRYCMMALVPLTCVWYYVERYLPRKGEQKLPVSVRIRMRQPPSAS